MGACLALLSGGVFAQTPAELQKRTTADLPGWIVLALKPTGAKRVRPVTGVVIAEEGLVIVPQDFVEPGDQIIVLDGGTDIIANGRAAKIRQQIPDAGLTVLVVPGLHRQPPSLAATATTGGEEIYLAAFPPAEQIAQGAAPVWASTQLAAAGGAATAIAAGKALPNVTGPLLDSCGNLVGFSSADGVQSMETTKAPAYLWKEGLLGALGQVAVTLAEAPCPVPVNSAVEETPGATAPETPAADAPAGSAEAPADKLAPAPADGTTSAPGPENSMPQASAKRTRAWLLLLAAGLLLGLLWQLFRRGVFKGRKKGSGGVPEGEPHTEATAKAPGLQSQEDAAPGADCLLEIRGSLPDGTPFTRSCEINGAAINVVIGRGQADIPIDSQDVHREHVRLSGSVDMLTISDLGSSRGTWINRVPCLKGEIMFIGEEDTIFLGDVSFQVSVRARQQPGMNSGS